MNYTAGDYVIITSTGRRALVLEVDGNSMLVQPLTRNSKGHGKQMELEKIYVLSSEVSDDIYGDKP
jgi:hypothetical protein